jgi:hypothetical protein
MVNEAWMTGTTGRLTNNPSEVVGQSGTLILVRHMELGRVRGVESFTNLND